MKTLLFSLVILFAVNVSAADGPCILEDRGHFQIHVGTGGLFGVFAHSHLIQADKIAGCATIDTKDLLKSSIQAEFPTAAIRVLDPKENAKDRAEVQKTMETQVLRISEFPKITFQSTSVEPGDAKEKFRVRGNLTILGKTEPVIIPVTLTRESDGTYHAVGEYKFKQTAFGIKPIQLAGGTVKVKDELRIDFELFLR